MISVDSRMNNGEFLSTGFWLKGAVLYPISKTHIRAVLDFPELFSREKSDLLKTYKKHNEKIGFEGKAREEIIFGLLQDGWVRIRHYFKPRDYWTIHSGETGIRKPKIDLFFRFGYEYLGITIDDRILVNGEPYML